MPQLSQVLRELAIGMLTAGMSTRAVALELNVHFSTISRLQMCFREFGSTSVTRFGVQGRKDEEIRGDEPQNGV